MTTLSLLLLLILTPVISRATATTFRLPLTYETDDYLYYVELGIGTPAKPFRLVLDTGSANLWVPSSSCTSPLCSQRAQYNPGSSRTSKVQGTVVPIQYGDGGEVITTLVTDVVTIPAPQTGSGSSNASRSFIQQFGMAVQMQGAIEAAAAAASPWDGILGMGRSALAAGGVQVPVMSMYKQGLIDSPVFGIYLVPNASAAVAGGELIMGGWSSGRIQGEVTWIDVVNSAAATTQGFWSVPIPQLQLQWPDGSSTVPQGACGSTSSSSSSSNCVGLLDSGTAQVMASIKQVAAVNAALGGSPTVQQLPFDCSDAVQQILEATAEALNSATPQQSATAVCSKLYGAGASSLQQLLCAAVQLELSALSLGPPSQAILNQAQQQGIALCSQLPYTVNVTLSCDKVAQLPQLGFNIGGSVFSLSPADYAYQSPSDLLCYSGIEAIGGLPPGTWLLGNAFMKNYYTVFDYGTAGVSSSTELPDGRSGTGSTAQPRVGIGMLNAAEKAVADDLFDKAVASKQGATSSAHGLADVSCRRWDALRLLLLLVPAAAWLM